MRYIHCTQRLLKEINPHIDSSGEDRKVIGLGDWYSNIFSFTMKKNVLIFMNAKTLYSFFVTDIYRDDIDNFGKTFIYGLITSLENNGFEKNIIKKIINEYPEIEIVKTKSRSILGSMNDHVDHYYSCFEKGNSSCIETIEEFNRSVVEIPMGALKFKTPLEALRELIKNEIND
jgi:hypothetical protein